MATLYKKGSIWQAKYYLSNGTRVSKSTGETRRRYAEKIANDMEADARRQEKIGDSMGAALAVFVERAAREAHEGTLTLAKAEQYIQKLHALANPKYEVISLNQHFSQWIRNEEEHTAPKTQKAYWDTHRRMGTALGKRIFNDPVGNLTEEDVAEALKAIHKGRAASTANMDLRLLRRVLEAAVRKGLASANVAKAIRPFKTTDSTEKGHFTKEDFQALLKHVRAAYEHDEWEGLILIAGHTGLRMQDVLGLSRSNVVGSRLVVPTGKTGTEVEIPMTPPVARWIDERSGAFFPILSPKLPGSLSTTFTRIMERAGVPRDVEKPGGGSKRRSFHSLRHSFASWLADADVHADVRKKLTGHKADGIHARYSHHDEALDKAMENLPTVNL